MRVTDSTLYAQIRAGLATRREQLEKAQTTAITERRVTKPSDDPAAAAQARSHTSQQTKAQAHERSVNVALTALQVADAALDQVGEGFTRARELALQAATGTISDQNRADLGKEVDALRSQLLNLANSQSAGQYVFAGVRSGSSAYQPDGSYSGDPEVQQVEVGKNLRVPIGIPGDRAFSTAGGESAFTVLSELSEALTNNDLSGIRGTLDRLSSLQDRVLSARGELGANMDTAQVALSVSQRVQDQASIARSKLVEADPITAFSDLARAQSALEAAVAVASQLPPAGLASRARL